MADKKKKKNVKTVSFAYIHKLAAGVSLLALLVVMLAGIMAEASVVSISVRSVLVIIVISIVSRIVIQILSSYEEINSGKG
jgi:predicted ferric reductase